MKTLPPPDMIRSREEADEAVAAVLEASRSYTVDYAEVRARLDQEVQRRLEGGDKLSTLMVPVGSDLEEVDPEASGTIMPSPRVPPSPGGSRLPAPASTGVSPRMCRMMRPWPRSARPRIRFLLGLSWSLLRLPRSLLGLPWSLLRLRSRILLGLPRIRSLSRFPRCLSLSRFPRRRSLLRLPRLLLAWPGLPLARPGGREPGFQGDEREGH